MEDSFVQTMLGNNGHHLLRLDRYIPDSSESTLDLKPEIRSSRRKRLSSTSDIDNPKTRTDMKTRRPSSSQPHTSSQDQVVPQLG